MKRKQNDSLELQEPEELKIKKIKPEDSAKSQSSQNFIKNFRLKLKGKDFYDGE